MEKKVWKKPELILLLKGSPDEDVLCGCKGAACGNSLGNMTGICQSAFPCGMGCASLACS